MVLLQNKNNKKEGCKTYIKEFHQSHYAIFESNILSNIGFKAILLVKKVIKVGQIHPN
jgi:hypothetical protein